MQETVLIALLLLINNIAGAQAICDTTGATVQPACATSDAFVGTQTTLGAFYTWAKDGRVKKGPVAGDGGAISLPFAINSAADAGYYTIEQNIDGIVTCATTIHVLYNPLPVAQILTGGGPLCNGGRVLSVSNSEAGVTYELFNGESGPLLSHISSTGGPFNFDPVYQPGNYRVKAYKTGCSAFEGSAIYFGSVDVSMNLVKPTINFTNTNSISLTWNGGGNYIIEYGPPGFSPGYDGTAGSPNSVIINASNAIVNINSLPAGSKYDIYVRQQCSSGEYLTSLKVSAATDCNNVTSFPYVQGFEGMPFYEIPACWAGATTVSDFLIFNGNSNTGTYYLYGFNGSIILPRMTLTGAQRLKFFVRGNSLPGSYKIKLSTGNNNPASFITTLLTDTVVATTFSERIVNLNGYTGPVYLSLQMESGSLAFDDFVIENVPACPGASLLRVTQVGTNSSIINWRGNGTYVIEYGIAGFTPGNGATPGIGGTIINNATSPLSISGLAINSSYDVYVRQNCTGAGNGYSANSPKTNFTTMASCTSAIPLNACVNTTANISEGTGALNFGGNYPTNSTGTATPGKEILYSFTPPATGVYYVEIVSNNAFLGVSFLYKQQADGCTNKGWTGIVGQVPAAGSKHPIGLLQAGTTYYLMVDNETQGATNTVFKICKANVVSNFFSGCYTNLSGLNSNIPAFSPKKEYILDNGNLVAELDFSNTATAPGFVSYAVNLHSGGSARRDNNNVEYLSRDFTIKTTGQISGAIGLKLFFQDSELQQLINEPNDGNADVNDVNGLRVSRTAERNCNYAGNNGPNTAGEWITATSAGTYDANAYYVQVNARGLGTFYLHGGNSALIPADMSVCPGTIVLMSTADLGTGFSYQWQVDDGAGYVDIGNVNYYSGTNTKNLVLIRPPTSFYGNKYRCISTGPGGPVISTPITLKFSMEWKGSVDDDWINPRNWVCANQNDQETYRVPDGNVDVLIPEFTPYSPVVRKNASCRSLNVAPNQSLTLAPNRTLIITGHQ